MADYPVQVLGHRDYAKGLSVVYLQSHHYVERFIDEVREEVDVQFIICATG